MAGYVPVERNYHLCRRRRWIRRRGRDLSSKKMKKKQEKMVNREKITSEKKLTIVVKCFATRSFYRVQELLTLVIHVFFGASKFH